MPAGHPLALGIPRGAATGGVRPGTSAQATCPQERHRVPVPGGAAAGLRLRHPDPGSPGPWGGLERRVPQRSRPALSPGQGRSPGRPGSPSPGSAPGGPLESPSQSDSGVTTQQETWHSGPGSRERRPLGWVRLRPGLLGPRAPRSQHEAPAPHRWLRGTETAESGGSRCG